MAWWIWVILGLIFLGVEVAAPGGVVMLFFGAAAIIVGLLVAPGLAVPVWAEFALFSVLSVVSLLTLRGPLLKRMKASSGQPDDVDSLIGATAIVESDLAPGAEGKAELRGTTWSARNAGGATLSAGAGARVARVEGLTLILREEP